jgi:phage anti-repressor protein
MELIKIQENDKGQKVVSARDLHKFLESTERFSNWFERQLQYDFIEDQDFTSVKSLTLVNNGASRELQDFALTLDCAKEISMIQRTEKGKEARKYFINCEKQLQARQLPTTYLEALTKLVETETEKQNLQIELDEHKAWYSVKRVCLLGHFKSSEAKNLWRALKKYSIEHNYQIQSIFDANYGEVKTYHKDVWFGVYGVNL